MRDGPLQVQAGQDGHPAPLPHPAPHRGRWLVLQVLEAGQDGHPPGDHQSLVGVREKQASPVDVGPRESEVAVRLAEGDGDDPGSLLRPWDIARDGWPETRPCNNQRTSLVPLGRVAHCLFVSLLNV